MQNSDRRRDVRINISPPAQIVWIGRSEAIEVLNASYRGLFGRMAVSPQLNELMKLRLELPARGPVSLHGITVRIIPDTRTRTFGVGFRFFALNGEDKRMWETYITSLLVPRQQVA